MHFPNRIHQLPVISTYTDLIRLSSLGEPILQRNSFLKIPEKKYPEGTVLCRDQTDNFDKAIQDTIETIHTDFE